MVEGDGTFGSGGAGGNAVVRGVVAVLSRDDRLLMIRRAEGLVLGGTWCFPGGTIEPGETQEEALVREIREEIALQITPGRRVWRWVREDGGLELQWWSAEIVGGVLKPDPSEVSEVRWMTHEMIRTTPGVLPNNVRFLEHLEGKASS